MLESISGAEIFAGFTEDGRAWAIAHREEIEQLVGAMVADLRQRKVRSIYGDQEVRKEFYRLRARYPEEVFGIYAYVWLLERRMREALP